MGEEPEGLMFRLGTGIPRGIGEARGSWGSSLGGSSGIVSAPTLRRRGDPFVGDAGAAGVNDIGAPKPFTVGR